MLGGKAAPLTFTLIPAQTESEAIHTEAYHAMRKALRALTAVKTCITTECTLMPDGDLLRHVTRQAKLFVDFFLNDKYGDTPL